MNPAAPTGAPALALPLPDQRSSFVLAGMAVVLVGLIWLLIRAIRRQGGFRPACRRLAWEARMTCRAFAEPVRVRNAHRRRIRTLTAFLADPAAPVLVDRVLNGARQSAGQGCEAPAVLVAADRRECTAVIAGRDPRPVDSPWREDSPGNGLRTRSVTAGEISTVPPGAPSRPTLPLVLGTDRLSGATVVADWACGPSVISLEGDTRLVRSVLQALAAQLDLAAHGPRVEIARGVHPRWPGRDLDAVLDAWETAAPSGEAEEAAPPVLVCWTPTGSQRARLAALAARGRVRALVGGRFPGACWSLHAETGGRLIGPGLGVDAEAAALGQAVAAGIRRYRRRNAGWWDARPEPPSLAEELDDGDGPGPDAPAPGPPARPEPEPPAVVGEGPGATAAGVDAAAARQEAGGRAAESPASSAYLPAAGADDFSEPDTGPAPSAAPASEPGPQPPVRIDLPAEPAQTPAGATRRPGVSAASRTPLERTPEHP
ncbi:hypothetical protein [Streptomyces sp. NPDC047315]|uniref:hypothetical protein n=1 Tax=Streptomyces sp. NPDC047315 TaxID=3155142 RepID=UPI0033F92574